MSASPICHFCHNPMQIIVVPTDDGPRLHVSRCLDCDNIVPFEPEGDAGLAEAIRACGSRRALAGKIGLSRRTVSQWHRVPQLKVAAVSRVTGIPDHVLRPDLLSPSIEPILPYRLDVLAVALPPTAKSATAPFPPNSHSAEETIPL